MRKANERRVDYHEIENLRIKFRCFVFKSDEKTDFMIWLDLSEILDFFRMQYHDQYIVHFEVI